MNRHCAYQADVLIKTGKPHIQEELNKILAIVNTLPSNSVVVDAGANIGLVSIPIAQLVKPKKGRVYAFEVQRMMFYALCGSAALNDLDNLIVQNQALGAEVGQLQTPSVDYSQPQDFGLFSLADQTAEHGTPNSLNRVKLVTIDSLHLPRLDFLKIDVEGMEVDVLKGARASIERYLPWCWVEYWKADVEDIKAQFVGLDYQFHKMDSLNMLCAPRDKLTKAPLAINAKEM